jgi:hypothetical protein
LIGFWTVTKNSDLVDIAIGIEFQSQLIKLLPKFLDELDVPFVGIATSHRDQDKRKVLLFNNRRESKDITPYFHEDWVFKTGTGEIAEEHVFPQDKPCKETHSNGDVDVIIKEEGCEKLKQYSFLPKYPQTNINIMAEPIIFDRNVYIKAKINPVEEQKDEQNFRYVIAQSCSDITLSVEECFDSDDNLIVVVADE